MLIVTRRIYDEVQAGEFRVLVDRLWPRGISKERAALDLWDKDVAPSAELRKAWGHDPATYQQFSEQYRAELDASGAPQALLAAARDHGVLALLYAAHSPENHASVLADYLRELITA